jgi:RNase P/RNase MRP subunit POP5
VARRRATTFADLDDLVADITVDAYGDDEAQTAFLEVFTGEVTVPGAATVLGVAVEVVGFDFRDARRGIVARCRRDSLEQELAAVDLVFAPDSVGAWVQAAYRRWLGLPPHPADVPPGWRPSWL